MHDSTTLRCYACCCCCPLRRCMNAPLLSVFWSLSWDGDRPTSAFSRGHRPVTGRDPAKGEPRNATRYVVSTADRGSGRSGRRPSMSVAAVVGSRTVRRPGVSTQPRQTAGDGTLPETDAPAHAADRPTRGTSAHRVLTFDPCQLTSNLARWLLCCCSGRCAAARSSFDFQTVCCIPGDRRLLFSRSTTPRFRSTEPPSGPWRPLVCCESYTSGDRQTVACRLRFEAFVRPGVSYVGGRM